MHTASNANYDRGLEETWTKEVGINKDASDEVSKLRATVAELEENFTIFSTGSYCRWWFKAVLVYRFSLILKFNGVLWLLLALILLSCIVEIVQKLCKRAEREGQVTYEKKWVFSYSSCNWQYSQPFPGWMAQPHGDVVRPLAVATFNQESFMTWLQPFGARMPTW